MHTPLFSDNVYYKIKVSLCDIEEVTNTLMIQINFDNKRSVGKLA